MSHTFDASGAHNLEDEARYRYCSRDELVALLDPDPDDVVLDLGSGTGFYTRDVAAHVEWIVAVDIQHTMQESFTRHGVPANVDQITAAASEIPIEDGRLDAVVSTMTFHELGTPDAVAELERVLTDEGRVVLVDWSANGEHEAGPPLSERLTATEAAEILTSGGFAVEHRSERPETFTIRASIR